MWFQVHCSTIYIEKVWGEVHGSRGWQQVSSSFPSLSKSDDFDLQVNMMDNIIKSLCPPNRCGSAPSRSPSNQRPSLKYKTVGTSTPTIKIEYELAASMSVPGLNYVKYHLYDPFEESKKKKWGYLDYCYYPVLRKKK